MSAGEVGSGPPVDADAVAHLRASATFGTLDDDALLRLAAHLSPRTVQAGETIIVEGDPPGDAYFVVAGRLQATTSLPDGSRIVVGLLGAGDVVGEMALITQESRSATVTALRDSKLYRMSERGFRDVVMADPRILVAVTRSIVRRLDRSIHNRKPVTAVAVVGVVPAGTAAEHRAFADRYSQTAGERLKVAVVGSQRLLSDLGTDATDADVTAYLHRVEMAHDLTLLVADDGDSAWTRRCSRDADVNLLVGHRRGLNRVGPVEAALSHQPDDMVRPPCAPRRPPELGQPLRHTGASRSQGRRSPPPRAARIAPRPRATQPGTPR